MLILLGSNKIWAYGLNLLTYYKPVGSGYRLHSTNLTWIVTDRLQANTCLTLIEI